MRTARLFFTCLALTAAVTVSAAEASEPDAREPQSDEDPIELDTLEIIAHPSGADERAAAIWVQRPADDAPATHVADLFALVPGLHMDQAGGAGGRSTLYLRGGEENHTLVLLDEVPLNDPTNSRGGGVDFSLIEPATLDSAAVVRGPGSMRHGPDAISGVIHLTTSGARTPGTRGSIEGGGDGLGRAAVSTTLIPFDHAAATVGASWHEEDAANAAGGMRRRFFHGAYDQSAGLDLKLAAWHLDQDSSAFPDDSGGVRYAVIRELEERKDQQSAASFQLGQRDADGAWAFSADAARLESRTVSPGVAPGVRDPAGLPASIDDIQLDRFRTAFLLERDVAGWTMTGGLDAAREDGSDEALLDFGPFQLPAGFKARRDRVGGFIEGVGSLTDRITLAAGIRGDRFDDVGTHATGRAGLLGALGANTQVRVNAGTGFKAPSFFGLAHPLVGNTDLKPERGRSIDAGLRHTFASGRGLVDFTLFAAELRNGADFDPGPPPRIANVAGIRSRGAEVAAIWKAANAVHVSGSLSYTDARARPEDTRMRSRPRWRGAVAAGWQPLPRLALDLRLTAVDRMPDSSIATGDVMLPGWARVDLGARWSIDERWSVSATCDNLLDRRHEEIVGFTAPGRRLRGGAQFRF